MTLLSSYEHTFTSAEGHPCLAITLGERVYVIDRGRPWLLAWCAPEEVDAGRVPTADDLAQVYAEHRADPTRHVTTAAAWPLRPDTVSSLEDRYRSQPVSIQHQWVEAAMSRQYQQSPVCMSQELLNPNSPLQAESLAVLSRSYAGVGRVREALDPVLLEALRPYHLDRAEIIHWILEVGQPAAHYRLQAVQQQPYLLPKLLQVTGGWPSTLPDWRTLDDDLATSSAALMAAIDQGHAWRSYLGDSLRAIEQAVYSFSWPSVDFKDHRGIYARHVALAATVDVLHGQPPERSLGWLTTYPSDQRIQTTLVAAFPALSLIRRPFSKDAAEVPLSWMIRLSGGIQMRLGLDLPLSDRFLKGMPVSWADPAYQAWSDELRLVVDAAYMMLPGAGGPARSSRVVATRIGTWFNQLTARQWKGWSDRAHTWQIELQAQEPADPWLRWSPVAPPGYAIPGGKVVELTCDAELKEEGQAMQHCVGGYGIDAGLGRCRVFSIRNAHGQRISTLSVKWDAITGSAFVEQNFGHKNTPAPSSEAWMASFLASLTPGPWPATPHALACQQEAEKRASPAQHQLATRLWEEADRRFPEATAMAHQAAHVRQQAEQRRAERKALQSASPTSPARPRQRRP